MTIRYTRESIFVTGAQALVCPVNCVGVMGKGLAREFRLRYPSMFPSYVQMCKSGELGIGLIGSFRPPRSEAREGQYILFFPTKKTWQNKSRLAWVGQGLEYLRDNIGSTDSIALPALGCGCGGLDWKEVKPLIEMHLGGLKSCEVIVCEPRGAK